MLRELFLGEGDILNRVYTKAFARDVEKHMILRSRDAIGFPPPESIWRPLTMTRRNTRSLLWSRLGIFWHIRKDIWIVVAMNFLV